MKDLIRIRQQIISPIITLNGNSLEELLDNGFFTINTLYGRYLSPRTNSYKIDRLRTFIEIPKQCLNVDIEKYENQLFYFSFITKYSVLDFLENDPELWTRYNEAHARLLMSGSLKIQKEMNLIYNIAVFKLAIKDLLQTQVNIITTISRYGKDIDLSYRDLKVTNHSFNNKESWKNDLNTSKIHDVSLKDINVKKMSKLINKLNKLNYFKNE